MKKLFTTFVITVICSTLFQIDLFAGVTGKIAGKVTDAETGEPLIGINVIIDGTTIGAATDINGNYIINNVEPGVYTLVLSGVDRKSVV